MQSAPLVLRTGVSAQRSRAAIYAMAGVIGLISVRLGLMEASYWDLLIIVVVAYATIGLFHLTYRRLGRRGAQADLAAGLNLARAWLLCDGLLITWAISTTGGAVSPWFPWYLANISGAAFILGEGAAFLMALFDTVAYVGVLYWRGDINGLDPALYRPLTHMVFLYGASFFFIRGVTQLRKRQQLIRRLRADERRQLDELKRLTSELDQRTREVQAVNLELREATRLKSQFLANMSHELRTPLNSIIGFSEILLRKLGGELVEKHERFLNNIHHSGKQLLGMINDILDLAKIEVGKMELQSTVISVTNLVEGVRRIVKGSIQERSITIEADLPDPPLTFEADPARMKQILYNLLSNAVKFSPEASLVTLRARALDSRQSPLGRESVEIAVIDRGIGIDPRHQHLIFEEFRQVDGSSTRRFEGAGLGLALVRRFVELHQGVVRLESAPGQGSTFAVVIPSVFCGPGAKKSSKQTGPSVRIEGDRAVLVVEDDPSAFETISQHLISSGYVPVRATNGNEAIDLIRSVSPQAVILDIVLPGIDGWEVLKLLKAEPQTCGIPVIIVSMLANRELGLTLGADDYFTKPVDGERLRVRLAELLLSAGVKGARVLVIDDEPMVHELLTHDLEPHGIQLLQALSGKQGLELAHKSQPDLIILDLMMEEMDGFEVAAKLRTDVETAHVPIVVLTAKDLTSEDRQRLRGKIQGLLEKASSSSSELVSVMEPLLARRRAARGAAGGQVTGVV